MFEVGDRVVCVDDSDIDGSPYPVRAGQKFTVLDIFLKGHRFTSTCSASADAISIGLHNHEVFRRIADIPEVLPHYDIWHATRFRKLRDISQSLRELKELAINCPALVEP